MAELKLATFDAKGVEKFFPWALVPIDSELQFIRSAEEGESTSSVDLRAPLFAKAVYVLTIGAGTLRNPENRVHLLRLVFAHKILWKHRIGTKDVWREYTAGFDRQVVLDYLDGRRSLPRLKVTLTETRGRWYRKFEEFIKEVGDAWART